jgi:hypothetical protein
MYTLAASGAADFLNAGARRRGGCLQSSSKWVRLPPAFFEATSSKVMLMLGSAARLAPVKRLAWRVPDMRSNEGIT